MKASPTTSNIPIDSPKNRPAAMPLNKPARICADRLMRENVVGSLAPLNRRERGIGSLDEIYRPDARDSYRVSEKPPRGC
jgi:hypothetical protein